MVAGSCFSPSNLTIPGTASINGPIIGQANQSSLASLNLLEAGTTPTPIVKFDSFSNAVVAAASGKNVIIGGAGNNAEIQGIVSLFNGNNTTGTGLAAEIAAVATGSPVALATSSTTVLTYTSSLTTGTYLVSVNAMSTAAAQVATFTVAYEDNSFSVAATATLTSPTLGSGAAYGTTIEINAKTGTAITVSGSCTTANDVKATAHIFGPL